MPRLITLALSHDAERRESTADDRDDQDPPRCGPADPAHRGRDSGLRLAREAGRGHGQGDLSSLARPYRHHLSRSETVTRGPDPRHRLFRRAGHASPAAEILPEGIFQDPA